MGRRKSTTTTNTDPTAGTSNMDLPSEENLINDLAIQVSQLAAKLEQLIQKGDNQETASTSSSNLTKLKWSDVEKSLLSFDGTGEVHPTEFLDSIENAFDLFPMTLERQKIVILGLLKGEPRSWFSAYKFEINSFVDFKNKFINKYWNQRKRRRATTEFLSITYNIKIHKKPSLFVLELKKNSIPNLKGVRRRARLYRVYCK